LDDRKYKSIANDLGIKKYDSAKDIYRVEKVITKQKDKEYQTQLNDMQSRQDAIRAEDIARAQYQFDQTAAIQQRQFDQSMAAQEAALQMQLDAQADLQRRSEEASLRSQVPQFTNNSSNARRVKAKASGKQTARQAALGASQLRVPLGISSSRGTGAASGGSPVKLNIGA
jgi:hypothetical protein